jgi:hypothetical protein
VKRTQNRIGDVFSVQMDTHSVKYFQYIANDATQLGSNVIRAFKPSYRLDDKSDLSSIINDDVQFYAHVFISLGIEMHVWQRVGHVPDVGDLDMWFRGTNDYGTKVGEKPIRVSHNWYVWRINEDHRRIGSLDDNYKNASVGLVINPLGILELLKGNKYPINYPD